MKTKLIALLLFLSVISCTEEKTIEVPSPQETLVGTTWTRLDNVENNVKVYEVIEFTKDTIRVNYKRNKTEMYVPVGNFQYMYDTQKKQFWVKNPDYSLVWGDIEKDRMYFGGKELIKER